MNKTPSNEAILLCKSSDSMDEIPENTVTLTVTSPPYWNAIDYDVHAKNGNEQWYRSRQYAEGYESLEEYLYLMQRIFAEVLRVTRPSGLCAIVVGTVLSDGQHIPLPQMLCTKLQQAGWEFHQDIILEQGHGRREPEQGRRSSTRIPATTNRI